ncbi:hypothetical protein OKC48_06845 [Methylorubrum extorquens]|uniref:hypothetical protein n=1 Tax=Methylorubrum extorquens TaxID=408 RepID=UPI0022389649|nr:hypothetical protein [Methylorubrum extorquens]UYW28232.1 hypothetical protein OKC48_06845 [Methylorubrum extorquens]
MDFEGMGAAIGYGRAIRAGRQAAWAWQDRAEALERELARARVEAAAQDAGRRAQIRALRTAMDVVAPFDPVLRRTGRMYEEGTPERVYEAAYAPAYDAVARAEGLPPARRPMTPQERAAAAEAAVLAEPVTVRRCLWWQRVHWRGAEYRTEAGAIRARAAAARAAKESVSA